MLVPVYLAYLFLFYDFVVATLCWVSCFFSTDVDAIYPFGTPNCDAPRCNHSDWKTMFLFQRLAVALVNKGHIVGSVEHVLARY